jgi:hypothetical protein
MWASLSNVLLGAGASATSFLSVVIPDGTPSRLPVWSEQPVVITREIATSQAWDDLVLSWTARTFADGVIRFEVAAQTPTGWTKFYSMGDWSETVMLRRSLNDQKDADGDVETDTWLLTHPTRRFRLRLTLTPGTDRTLPHVERVDLSMVLRGQSRPDGAPRKDVWGTTLPVPKRCQGHYANGGVICSPTSVSMLLAYWAQALGRPEIDRDVPLVQAGVFDDVWGGTGNWPFNMAYIARTGLRAYVTRMNNIRDLEDWIAAGVPVATSVSYDLLKGKGKKGANDGHLVVLIGFTRDGDPVFNDPGKSDQPQHVYNRAHFMAAWTSSGRTVYVAHPYGHPVPKSRNAPWDQRPAIQRS